MSLIRSRLPSLQYRVLQQRLLVRAVDQPLTLQLHRKGQIHDMEDHRNLGKYHNLRGDLELKQTAMKGFG